MDGYIILLIFFISADTLWCSPVEFQMRTKRETDLNPGNWDSCRKGEDPPKTRVDTTARVVSLRAKFAENGIQAYYIPSEDAHQSEYPSDYDKRRGYITGFQGSAGYAMVTTTKQALWTDGRYFLEAEDTLDCDWILMRMGETGVPTATEWLGTELNSSDVVGASPFLVGSATWKSMEQTLSKKGIILKKIETELIDEIWTTGRPDQPSSDINALPMQFAGRSWEDKISDMRKAMADKGVDMLVVTGLDETAWLFNLRASDITYNPFFISYAILEHSRVRLYILDKDRKLIASPTDPETNVTMATHLNTGNTGTCSLNVAGSCVEVLDYDPSNVIDDVNTTAAGVQGKVWLGYSCNYAIYSVVPTDNIHQDNTPVATTKCRKNAVEVKGMKKSHIRDAAALISFMAKLEKGVVSGEHWTEVSAAQVLKGYREKQMFNRGLSFPSISSSGSNGAIIHYRPTNLTAKAITTTAMYLLDSGAQYLRQQYNRGLSFNSISASGSNGAIIHYSPSNATDRTITTSDMYLLDSGGQYLDGTTDVTRTFHFGTPTNYQKECYTRVLMGHIDLFQAVWPKGLYGREIDAFARGPLWDVGLVYRHGTGHGIGMYLSVHEGPGRVSLSHSSFDRDEELDEFQFFSDEPGYYEDGQFGIRLENIVMVKNASTKYSFPDTQFLTFDHVTLVPYEPKLIDYTLLNEAQIKYLNDYHKLVRDVVGPELQHQRETAGYDWMMEKTKQVPFPAVLSGAQNINVISLLVYLCLSVIYLAD